MTHRVKDSVQKQEMDERKKTTVRDPVIRRRHNLPEDESKYR